MHFSLFLYPFLTSRLDNKVQSLNESVYLGRFQVNSDRISSQHKNLVSLWPVITKLQPFLLFNLTPPACFCGLWFQLHRLFLLSQAQTLLPILFSVTLTPPPPRFSACNPQGRSTETTGGGGQQQRKEIQWICAWQSSLLDKIVGSVTNIVNMRTPKRYNV